MPVEDFEPEIEELAAKYEQAAILITGLIASLGASPSPAAIRTVSAQIAALLTELLTLSQAWTEAVMPRVYLSGVAEAQKSMGRPSEASLDALTGNHRQSLQLLAEDLISELARATSFMDADAKRSLREIGRARLQAALDKVHPQAEYPGFRQQLEERGVRFVDRSGRGWKPGNYSRLVLRTHSAVVLNQGHINAAAEHGSRGVRVFDGRDADSDEPCKRAAGQVWSLAYAAANRIEHPNCVRAFAAMPVSWRGRLDRVMEGERRKVAA